MAAVRGPSVGSHVRRPEQIPRARKRPPLLGPRGSGQEARRESRAAEEGGLERLHALTGRFWPVMASGLSTSLICASLRIFFARMISRMPFPVFMASAASSVDLS